jgi:hypothetical protein
MLIDHIDYPNDVVSTNGLFYGLAFAGNSTLYAAQGANDTIAVVTLVPNDQILQTGISFTQPGDFPSGPAVDSRSYLYVLTGNIPTSANPDRLLLNTTQSLQVLGDVPGGNGDSSLTLFRQSITPNLHARAERFLMMDN